MQSTCDKYNRIFKTKSGTLKPVIHIILPAAHLAAFSPSMADDVMPPA